MSGGSNNNKESDAPREFSQNLQHHLWDRESGYSRRCVIHNVPPWHQQFEQETLKCITPNLTIQNVDKPLGFMRKFTPNGKMLISFSHNQRFLEVYEFQGVHAAASLLQNLTTECITAADHCLESLLVRQQIFERLVRLKFAVRVDPGAAPYLLNREFSIFLDDGHYVLVAATVQCDSAMLPPIEDLQMFADLYDDCEFLGYAFYLVDLQLGCVSDRLIYQNDCIMLSHNHGVSVHGRIIAVLSKYRQNIDLYEMLQGKIVKLTSIGDFRNDLDASLFMRLPENSTLGLRMSVDKLPLSFLKQRILTHLYRQILATESEETHGSHLQKFYENYRIYERMLLSKIQLINDDHILIRYEEREGESIAHGKEPVDFKLYVFYCISDGTILRVFQKDSIELLYILRDFCDNFRNVRSLQTRRPSSSPSNNIHFRAAFNSAINTVPGGQTEAALRFNPTLPISTQSFATTQYMDYSLFNYDDRLISAMERPKISSLEPIKFSDRNTNITKFRLFLESPILRFESDTGAVNICRELVAFIFHPYEPLFISIQKMSTRYIVNFHIYNESTAVQS